MNIPKYFSGAGINTTNGLNTSLCNKTQWNVTLPEICANLTLKSSNGTGQNPTSSPHIRRESPELAIFRYFLISVIFILIIIGNSLTIHVVRSNRQLTSIKNYYYGYYIVNLSISDLLVGLVCLPTTVLYYIMPGPWKLGLFLCKLFPTLQIMVVSASISTLTVITFERFLAIVHPLKPRSSSKSVRYKIIFVWIWSFIIALPTLIAFQIDKSQQCIEVGITHWYTITLFMVNYAIPLTFIFLAYLRIIYELRSQSSTGSQRELMNHKRFLKLTVILVVSFALCFLPGHVMFFILDYSNVQVDHLTISSLIQYFHILIWFNSCLNPFIYGSVDTYFKRGFKKALGISLSNDSQEKTNLSVSRNPSVSRRSTFKLEKLPHGDYEGLSKELQNTTEQSNNCKPRAVRFTQDDRGQNNNLLADKRTFDLKERFAVKETLLNTDQSQKHDENGFISLVLYQGQCDQAISNADDENIECKEVFVDLSSSNKMLFGKPPMYNAVMYDLSNKDEFQKNVEMAKETII